MRREQVSAHSPRTGALRVAVLLSVIVSALGGCIDAPTTAATTRTRTVPAVPLASGAQAMAEPLTMRVCNEGAPATYTTSARVGVVASSVTLGDGHCALVWQADVAHDVRVTVSRTEDLSVRTDAVADIAGDASTVRYATSSASATGTASVAFVFFNTPAGADPWTLTKSLIKSCEQYNGWVAKVKEALRAYLASLTGDEAQVKATRAVVERAINEMGECTNDADLENKKQVADLLLGPINIIKASAKLWNSGFELYAVAIDIIIKSLTDPVGVPFDVINKTLDFMIDGADAVGNTEGAQKLKAVKDLKEKVKDGLHTIEQLRDALEKVRPFVLPTR